MILSLKVDEVSTIEWYDGVVVGFIRSQDEVFMCVLLALDASTSRRCYLLVKLLSDTLPTITFASAGDFFRTAISAALVNMIKLYTTTDEPIRGYNLNLNEAAESQVHLLISLQFPRIDEAVLETSVALWL